MAEFCKECFLEIEGYHREEQIVLSEDDDLCEGCGKFKPVVIEIKNDMEDEIVQYFVVNKELNMSPGKIAVQVAHVATIITIKHIEDYMFWKWFNSDQKKIILKGKQKDLERLIKQGFYYVRDLGLTEIEEGSLTVVGLYPMWKSEAQKYVKRLQLL